MSGIEKELDSFDLAARRNALCRLAGGETDPTPCGSDVNMHVHSFFSYNAGGHSPTHIAWEAHRAGLYAAGLCDFDVLDGLEEFADAGLTLGLRTTVNLETRAYLREYAHVDINSPGEPGVTYVMGAGFAREIPPDALQAGALRLYRDTAGKRNEALIERINSRVPEIAIDYEEDVLPLTPAGYATERHIVSAYVNKADSSFGSKAKLHGFWASALGGKTDEAEELLADRPRTEELVRAAFVKRGGLGYRAPTEETFPPVDVFLDCVLSCGAIPMVTWLDGTSEGESRPGEMLECMCAKGAAAVNVIPDRNWNVTDPAARALKAGKLEEFVRAAETLELPVNIGTEMNRGGLPFVDDLACEALRPYREVFVRGARIMVGHALLLRHAGFSYVGEAARAEFGDDTRAKNRFFESVGALPPLTRRIADRLEAMGPEAALGCVRDSARKGSWTCETAAR